MFQFVLLKMKFIIILVAFITVAQGQFLNQNWLDNLMGSIDQLNKNIQTNVQNLNNQIQNSVKQSVMNVDAYNQQVGQLSQIHTPFPINAINHGQTVIMNSGTGNSQLILSGRDANGAPYYRAIEEIIVGNVLKHIEKIYNTTTDKIEISGYTLDLSIPGAKPIPITAN